MKWTHYRLKEACKLTMRYRNPIISMRLRSKLVPSGCFMNTKSGHIFKDGRKVA